MSLSKADELHVLHEQQFDLVLLDWIMPNICGEKMATMIRNGDAGEPHRHVLIVVIRLCNQDDNHIRGERLFAQLCRAVSDTKTVVFGLS